MQMKVLAALFAAAAACASAQAATVLFQPNWVSGNQTVPLNVGTVSVTDVANNDLQFDFAFTGPSTGAGQPLNGAFIGTLYIDYSGFTNGANWSLVGSPTINGANFSATLSTSITPNGGAAFPNSLQFDLTLDTAQGSNRFDAGESLRFVLSGPTGLALSANNVTAIGAHFQSTAPVFGPGRNQDSAFYYTSPIPEPQEWAMMLAGLAAVGFIARQRRQAA